MRHLRFFAAAALLLAPVGAHAQAAALTCYKAVSIGGAALPVTLATGIQATGATITVYTDSTYSMVFVITGNGRTSLQSESGKVRIAGSSQYGKIIGLIRQDNAPGSTRISTFLSFTSDGKLKQRDSGKDVLYETHAGACPSGPSMRG